MTANPPRFLSPTVSSSQKVYSGSDGGGDVDGPSFLEGGEDGRTHSHGEVLSFSVKKEQPSSNSSSSIGCIICGSGGGRGGGRGGSCGHDAAAAAANSPTKTPRGGSSLSRPDNTCSVSSPTPLSNQKFTSPSYQCRCEQRRLELEKWREERKRRGEKEKLQATTTPPPFQTGSHVRQERIRKQQQTAPTPLTSPSPHRQRALRREDLSSPYRIAASPVVKKKTTAAAVGPTCSRRGHSIPTIPPSSSSTSSSVSGTKKKLQPKKKNSIHMDPSNAPTTTTSTNDEEQRTQTAGEGKETMTPSATTDVESIVADIEAWSLKMRHVVEDAARRSTQQANQNIKLEEDKRVHGEEGQGGGGGFRFDEYLKPDTPDRDDENMEEDDEQAASYEKSSSPAPAKPYAHHDMPPQDRSARPIKMEENDEGEGAAATEPNADHTDNMATFRSLRTPTGQIMQIENQGHEPVQSPSFHVFSPKAASTPATPPPAPPPTPLDEGQTETQNYRETTGAEKSSFFHATNPSTPAVGEEFRESIRYMIRTLGEQLINIHNVSQSSNNDNNNTINTPTNSNSTLFEAQNQLNQTTIQLSQTLLKIEQKAEAMIHVLKLNDARTEALQRENKELRAMIKRALEYQAVRHEIHTRENAWEERFNSLISSVRGNRYRHHHHHAHDPPPPRTSLVSSSSPYETPTTTTTATATRTWNVNSNGAGSGARRPVSQGRFTGVDSRDTTATTGHNNTNRQNDVRRKDAMIRGSGGVDAAAKTTPLMKRLDATDNACERDIFDSKNQRRREKEENGGDYLLSRHSHRPNVYPAVQQSPGTMFVSELSEVMELDEGHHWRLADIMDKNWSRG